MPRSEALTISILANIKLKTSDELPNGATYSGNDWSIFECRHNVKTRREYTCSHVFQSLITNASGMNAHQ